MKLDLEQAMDDISFLADRCNQAGCCNFTIEREVGMSSNSIVAIAYGSDKEQVLPWDKSDLAACENMFKKLPAHRKTPFVMGLMEKARKAVAP